MNRHHPYGYDNSGRRGGSSPPGPGPDRYHNRFPDRGGGHPRGRGPPRSRAGSSNYDGNPGYGSYDQPIQRGSSSSDLSSYSSYESLPPDPYYQQNHNNYNSGGPSQLSNSASGYSEGYPRYEDASFEDGGPRRPMRKENPEHGHNSIIEERIQRERPCRILFIRNIKYETDSNEVRRQFEEYGDIKTFFDIIANRGMVFVTYYDLRAAERARERMQGAEISGRPIDVHYSLPRDDPSGEDMNTVLQGHLQVTLKNSPSGTPIDDNELKRKFQQFGDVKSVSPVGNRHDSKYVEFYDLRACEEAYDRLRNQPLQDGVMDIIFAWDNSEPPPPSGREHREVGQRPTGRGGRRGGHGGRGRGRGGRNWDEDSQDRRGGDGDWGRDTRRIQEEPRGSYPGPGRGDRGRGGGYGVHQPSGPSYRHPPPPPDVQRVPYPPPNGMGHSPYSSHGVPASYPPPAPPPPPPAPVSNIPAVGSETGPASIEAARRVQQLLAALKQTPAVTPPPGAPPVHAPVIAHPLQGPPLQQGGSFYGNMPGPPQPSYGGAHVGYSPPAGQNHFLSLPPPSQPPTGAQPYLGSAPPPPGGYQNFMNYLSNASQ